MIVAMHEHGGLRERALRERLEQPVEHRALGGCRL
jgi:hypothetical protein